MRAQYYSHSGEFSFKGISATLIIATLISCILAAVYGCAILFLSRMPSSLMPSAGCLVGIMMAMAFGGLVGIVTAAFLKVFSVRSNWVAALVIVLVCAIAFYFSWATWVWAYMRQGDSSLGYGDLFDLVTGPQYLWDRIPDRLDSGVWRFMGVDLLVWSIEAILIFGSSLFFGLQHMDDEPFCEKCKEWCEKKESVVATHTPSDLTELTRRMEHKDFTYLETLGPPGKKKWIRLDLYSCPKCSNLHTLCATRIKRKRKDTKETSLFSHLLLSTSDAHTLARVGESLRQKRDQSA